MTNPPEAAEALEAKAREFVARTLEMVNAANGNDLALTVLASRCEPALALINQLLALRAQPSREEVSDQQVEALARLLIQQRGVSPDTLYEHHEWEDFPVDERIDRQDPFTGEPRTTLMHRAWRRRVKDAREILALTGSSAGERA